MNTSMNGGGELDWVYIWVLPYKSDGGAHLKFSKQPLKDTKILFCGSFPPLILKQHIYWHYDNYF